MRQKLQSLSHQQAILLLTLITLGGEDDLSLLSHLPHEDMQALQSVGQELCQTPRKQMLPQLVKEIKHLITESQRSTVESVDPEWLAEFLLGESPRVISATLHQFPRSVAERIVAYLPVHLQHHIPPTIHEVHPDIAKRLKLALSKKIPTYTPEQTDALTMESLALLGNDEILTLLRELGFRELAIAFRAVGRGPLTELCRRLGPEEAERLLTVIRNLPNTSSEETKAAQRTIRSISLEHRSKSEIIEEAGLHKMQQALRDVSEECHKIIAFLLPRRVGKRIRTQQLLKLSAHDLYQVKLQVLESMQSLSNEGYINPQWGQMPIDLPEPPPPPEESMVGNSMSAAQIAEAHAAESHSSDGHPADNQAH